MGTEKDRTTTVHIIIASQMILGRRHTYCELWRAAKSGVFLGSAEYYADAHRVREQRAPLFVTEFKFTVHSFRKVRSVRSRRISVIRRTVSWWWWKRSYYRGWNAEQITNLGDVKHSSLLYVGVRLFYFIFFRPCKCVSFLCYSKIRRKSVYVWMPGTVSGDIV